MKALNISLTIILKALINWTNNKLRVYFYILSFFVYFDRCDVFNDPTIFLNRNGSPDFHAFLLLSKFQCFSNYIDPLAFFLLIIVKTHLLFETMHFPFCWTIKYLTNGQWTARYHAIFLFWCAVPCYICVTKNWYEA